MLFSQRTFVNLVLLIWSSEIQPLSTMTLSWNTELVNFPLTYVVPDWNMLATSKKPQLLYE